MLKEVLNVENVRLKRESIPSIKSEYADFYRSFDFESDDFTMV